MYVRTWLMGSIGSWIISSQLVFPMACSIGSLDCVELVLLCYKISDFAWWVLNLRNPTSLFVSLHGPPKPISCNFLLKEIQPCFSLCYLAGAYHSPLPILNPQSPWAHPDFLYSVWVPGRVSLTGECPEWCGFKDKWLTNRIRWQTADETDSKHMARGEKELWRDGITHLK